MSAPRVAGDGPAPVAVLYRGGSVYSDAAPFATALLVSDGVVAWIGDDDGADVQVRTSGALGQDLVQRDLSGALLAPAFVDAVGTSGADERALAALGVVAVLDGPGRSPYAALVRSVSDLDALAPGTVACLDPLQLDADLADRAASGVPLALGFASDAAAGPWRRLQHALALGLSARAAFVAHTRGAWRASSRPDGPGLGRLHVGAPASFAVWRAEELVTQAPDARRSSWSLDSRSGLPPLPRLGALHEEAWQPPELLLTVRDGVVVHDPTAG